MSCPSWRRALGSAATTSPNPPTCARGAHSGATKRTDRRVMRARAGCSIERIWQREREGGYGGVELAAVAQVHLVGALHRAARRLENASARVLEVLARA